MFLVDLAIKYSYQVSITIKDYKSFIITHIYLLFKKIINKFSDKIDNFYKLEK